MHLRKNINVSTFQWRNIHNALALVIFLSSGFLFIWSSGFGLRYQLTYYLDLYGKHKRYFLFASPWSFLHCNFRGSSWFFHSSWKTSLCPGKIFFPWIFRCCMDKGLIGYYVCFLHWTGELSLPRVILSSELNLKCLRSLIQAAKRRSWKTTTLSKHINS